MAPDTEESAGTVFFYQTCLNNFLTIWIVDGKNIMGNHVNYICNLDIQIFFHRLDTFRGEGMGMPIG